LYGWRHRGEGPQCYRIGRHVRNPLDFIICQLGLVRLVIRRAG
jgi:hypothetical protein